MEFKDHVIAVLDERHSKDMKYREQLRIVRWARNGRMGQPKLERRSFMIRNDGNYGPVKLLGLTYKDIEIICSLQDKIKEIMDSVPEAAEMPLKESGDPFVL